MVPEGWVRTQIGDVCSAIVDCVNKTAPVVEGPTPYRMIRTTNVRNNRVDTKNVRFVTEETFRIWTRRGELSDGDIILTREAPVGEVGQLRNASGVFLGQRTMVYRADPSRMDQQFLFQAMISPGLKRQYEADSAGGTVAHIRVPDCSKFLINVPPLAEQKKIAEILSTWDRAIEVAEAQLANARKQKRALMQSLLTGKRRFPEFEGQPWKEVRLGDVLKEVRRPVAWSDDDLYRLISVRRRSGGLFHREDLYGRDIKTKNLKNAKRGDFLISKMQVVHGAMGLVTENFDGMQVSGSYIAVVPRSPKALDIEFFDWLSRMPMMYHRAFLCSYGVHIEKMTFNFGLFLKELVAIPPTVQEQERIVEALETSEGEVRTLTAQIEKLNVEKKALMQQLLTGKRRVTV